MAPPPARHYAQRLAKGGVTPSSLAAQVEEEIKTLSIFRSLRPATEAQHAWVLALFDEFIECQHGGRLEVYGHSVGQFKELPKPTDRDDPIQFPPPEIIEAFLQFYVDGAVGKFGRKVQPLRLQQIWWTLCTEWARHTVRKVPVAARQAGDRSVAKLIVKNGLQSVDLPRGMTIQVLFDLQHELFMPDFEASMRQRFSITTAMAIGAQTILRPSSICVPMGVSPDISGLRTESFVLFIEPRLSTASTKANIVTGFVQPQWFKTHWSNKYYPVAEAPTIGGSCLLLVLGCHFLNGTITEQDFRSVLAPETLAGRAEKTEIFWPSSGIKAGILMQSKTRMLRTCDVRHTLTRLSFCLGYESVVRFNDTRHMGIQALVRSGADDDTLKDAAGHAPFTRSTMSYSGRGTRFNGIRALQAIDPNVRIETLTADRRLEPNMGAPRRLTAAEEKEVFESSEIVQTKRKALEEAEGSKERRKARQSLKHFENAVQKAALEKKRDEWFGGDRVDDPTSIRGPAVVASESIPLLKRIQAILVKSPACGLELVDALVEYKAVIDKAERTSKKGRGSKNGKSRAPKAPQHIEEPETPELTPDWLDVGEESDEEEEEEDPEQGTVQRPSCTASFVLAEPEQDES